MLKVLLLICWCATSSAELYNCSEELENGTDIIEEIKWNVMVHWLVPHVALSLRAGSKWYGIAESPEYVMPGAPSSVWCQHGQMPMKSFKPNGYLFPDHMGLVHWQTCFNVTGSFITTGQLYDLLLAWNAQKTHWETLDSHMNDCNDYASNSTNCAFTATYLWRKISNLTLTGHENYKFGYLDTCKQTIPSCLGPGPEAQHDVSTIVV